MAGREKVERLALARPLPRLGQPDHPVEADQQLGGGHLASPGGREVLLQQGCAHLEQWRGMGLDQVHVLISRGIEAIRTLVVLDFVDNDRAFLAGVGSDLAQRLFEGTLDDVDAERLLTLDIGLGNRFDGTNQGDAATGNDAFFHGRAGCMQRILDAGFQSYDGFGGIDGVLLASILCTIRSDVKILANYFLDRIPEMRPLLLNVDPFGNKTAIHKNRTALKQAVRWITFIIFRSDKNL